MVSGTVERERKKKRKKKFALLTMGTNFENSKK
jgi:hypothetical protein